MSIEKNEKQPEVKTAAFVSIDREIVKEILRYGVSQKQIIHIAYLLSLEIEDKDAFSDITTCIKKYIDLDFGDTKSSIFEEETPTESGIIIK